MISCDIRSKDTRVRCYRDRVPAPPAVPVVPAATARRLLLGGQGLLADPARRATPAAVYRRIESMGFLQMDTINVVDRAHHHIMRTRFDDYRPETLARLLERDRRLFEHWTHDASIIPSAWLPYWRIRFDRYRAEGHSPNGWWNERMGGEPERVITHVLERVRSEGPLMSRDFATETDGPSHSWWGWKPAKAALEYLWRTGDLAVTRRVNFQKVYDLTERVLADHANEPPPDHDTHVAWACRAALDRLGCAAASEIAAFLRAIPIATARAWCDDAVTRGEIVAVKVESEDGSAPRGAYAWPDWKRRAGRHRDPPPRLRLLSPFDPVIRDRQRLLRLFGFDYRFEAFVPAAKRRWGYYVLPILEGDRLVGRLDPKLHRDRGVLEVKGLWWEPGVRPTKTRRRALDAALSRFAASLGADRVTMPRRTQPAD
jgi:uncharacterized protein YcaQ